MLVYYSPNLYVEQDPVTLNYREYSYNSLHGKDYFWQNYDGGIYSERRFKAQYQQLEYYTDQNDELKDWGQQMGIAMALAGGCCFIIAFGVIFTQCIVRRRKRQKEAKQQKELAEMEGQEKESSSELDEISDMDKKKKTTKEKTQEALEKKAEEQTKDQQQLADISDDERDGSRREMLGNDVDATPVDDLTPKKVKGNNRFDADDGGEAELPQGNEEGGGFF